MAAWYEVLITSSITALIWMLCRLGELPSGGGKVFALVGVAIIPTVFFQVRNTTFPLKKKGFLDGDEESSGFWLFALILNSGLTFTIAIFVYPILLAIFTFFGFNAAIVRRTWIDTISTQ